MFANGAPNPNVESYVVDRTAGNQSDVVQKFTGNPLMGQPGFAKNLNADPNDIGENAGKASLAATGLAVGTGQVAPATGPNAGVQGSPVVANYYPKELLGTAGFDGSKPHAFVTTFNGTSGVDMNGDGGSAIPFNMAFEYGANGDGFFQPRSLQNGPDPRGLNKGAVDLAVGNDPVIAHGFGLTDDISADSKELPTIYLENQAPARLGNKTATGPVTKPGQLIDPTGVAVDRGAGDVFVGDDLAGILPRGTITRFNASSGVADAFVASPSLDRLRNVAVDPAGKYVYAAAGQYIYKLSPQLAILGRFGGPGASEGNGEGGLTAPYDVDIDSAHGAWVTDSSTDLVQYFYFPFGPD
jgi:hypothetical protein